MRLGAILAIIAMLLIGCGGGGGGATLTATIIGRVLTVESGGAPSPAASVQVGAASVLTSLSDGTFSLDVPAGATTITIDTRGANGVWTYTISPASGTVDIGDLWVGPQKITLKGKVVKSTDGGAISGATVTFAGRSGTTDSTGQFALTQVAYSTTTQAAFWGIIGQVQASGYFRSEFSASPHLASAGIVTISDVVLTPSDDITPPGPPYNVWGVVTAAGGSPGTIVTLKQGATTVRIYNVASDGKYFFWVTPGSYTMTFQKGALSGSAAATLTQANQIVRQDVTLH